MCKKLTVTILIAAILILLVLPLVSCSELADAHSLMTEFCSAYGIDTTIYSTTVQQGEEGYVTQRFFFSLYGEDMGSVSSFAVILDSDLDRISECGIFVCYSDYDAILVTDMLSRRLELIQGVAASSGLSLPDGAFIIRENKCVVLAALSDADQARRIWKRII